MKTLNESMQPSYYSQFHQPSLNLNLTHSYCKQTNNVLSPNPHVNDLTCFEQCSLWHLNLSTLSSKAALLCKENLLGKATSMTKANRYDKKHTDVTQFLPIDMRTNQRFVFDRNQPKMYLNLNFDLTKISSMLNLLTADYQHFTYEIDLLATLHRKNVFKEPINFKVKGYDIIKSIIGRLNDKTLTNKNLYEAIVQFQTTVFNNIQCTFGVDFSISKGNLVKYLNCGGLSSQNMGMIAGYDVRITKLRITYCLPLCVFAYGNDNQNHKQKITAMQLQQRIPMQAMMQQMQMQIPMQMPMTIPIQMNRMNQSQSQPQQSQSQQQKQPLNHSLNHSYFPMNPQGSNRRNFCNWHSFMSNTTPVIFECEDIQIKDVLNSFNHPSLFGVNCLFKLSATHYTLVKYFPILSSVYLEEKSPSSSSIGLNVSGISNGLSALPSPHSNQTFTFPSTQTPNVNDSSTLDSSFLTSISSTQDEKNTSAIHLNLNPFASIISFNEQIPQIFHKPSYQSQLANLLKKHPEIEDMTLNDITPQSCFSIIWTPVITPQLKTKWEGMHFVSSQVCSSFQVFYHFRNSTLRNSGHYLPVVGVKELNAYGEIVDTMNKNMRCFWFGNQSMNSGQYYFEQDLIFNQGQYCFLNRNCNIIGKV